MIIKHEEIWDMVHRIVGDWPLEEVEDLGSVEADPDYNPHLYYVRDIQAIKHKVYDLIENGRYDTLATIEDVLNDIGVDWA